MIFNEKDSVFPGCFYSTECTKYRGFDGFILVKITIKLTVFPGLWPEKTKIIVYFRGIIWYNIDSQRGGVTSQAPWRIVRQNNTWHDWHQGTK